MHNFNLSDICCGSHETFRLLSILSRLSRELYNVLFNRFTYTTTTAWKSTTKVKKAYRWCRLVCTYCEHWEYRDFLLQHSVHRVSIGYMRRESRYTRTQAPCWAFVVSSAHSESNRVFSFHVESGEKWKWRKNYSQFN